MCVSMRLIAAWYDRAGICSSNSVSTTVLLYNIDGSAPGQPDAKNDGDTGVPVTYPPPFVVAKTMRRRGSSRFTYGHMVSQSTALYGQHVVTSHGSDSQQPGDTGVLFGAYNNVCEGSNTSADDPKPQRTAANAIFPPAPAPTNTRDTTVAVMFPQLVFPSEAYIPTTFAYAAK